MWESGARTSLGDEDELRRFDQRRVLGPVDEAGQVAIVPVGPARGLFRHRSQRPELGDGGACYVEDHVVGASGKPQHGVVLRGRHDEAVDADHVVVEPFELRRRVAAGSFPPELGPESCHQIDAAHRCPRLTDGRDRGDEVSTLSPGREIEFQVGVRRCPQREDPALRSPHLDHRDTCVAFNIIGAATVQKRNPRRR